MKGEKRLVEEGKGKGHPKCVCVCVCVFAQDSLGDSLQGKRKQRKVWHKEDREISGSRREWWGRRPGGGERPEIDVGMPASWEGGREGRREAAHVWERQWCQHFLLDWSRDPCQVNILEIDSIKAEPAGGGGGAATSPFPLWGVLNEPGFFHVCDKVVSE